VTVLAQLKTCATHGPLRPQGSQRVQSLRQGDV
jgi:hypothetical protein